MSSGFELYGCSIFYTVTTSRSNLCWFLMFKKVENFILLKHNWHATSTEQFAFLHKVVMAMVVMCHV